jgi:hypothetical protein
MSRELWDAVQATLRKRPAKGKRWPEGTRHSMRENTPYLLSGVAYCAECGAPMVSGADNMSGHRKSPWPYYLCGRKKREGWSSCPTGKIGARKPERAVLQAVTKRVLTPDFVAALVAEVNDLMDRDAPTVRGQIQDTERQIARVEEAIDNLLDVAERFGAASAGPRLAEREAERAQLQARLQELVAQQEAHAAAISLEMVQDMLTEMHDTLTDGDLQAKRALLSKVVHKVVMGATGAELLYAFPLGE